MDDTGSSTQVSGWSLRQATETGSFFTPLLFSLAGAVATSMAIIAYHFIMVKYCIRRRRMAVSQYSRPEQGNHNQVSHGLEKHVLNKIPIFSYSRGNDEFLPLDHVQCVVCLAELKEGDEVRSLPHCGHAFHVTCIDHWFLAHTTCPICRAPVTYTANETTPDVGRDRHDQETQTSADFLEQRDADEGSRVLLRHCASLVLPREGKGQSIMRLTRSFSADRNFVIIDIQRDSTEKAPCSSSSSSSLKADIIMESKSVRGILLAHQLDCMPSRLLRSFSQLQTDRSTVVANGNFP
ncbi:hypothetical protein K2173_001887 [Erythroxylum novogranatense]|uniref:RING-type E3 ubiquitin transferase n=1 Tax=Erythroxylum novogranatense TaxID=1862640 RepID=A0AAV8SQ07_9ROSI|nr:hypothetical protein K2173_001887 [Erythroxylum novogranatense]